MNNETGELQSLDLAMFRLQIQTSLLRDPLTSLKGYHAVTQASRDPEAIVALFNLVR